MKMKHLPPIHIAGKTLIKLRSSYRDELGKVRSRHVLNWGTLPTEGLERLRLKYNAAARAGSKETGKLFEKIVELKKSLQEKRRQPKAAPKELRAHRSRDLPAQTVFFSTLSAARAKLEKKMNNLSQWDEQTREGVLGEISRFENWLKDARKKI